MTVSGLIIVARDQLLCSIHAGNWGVEDNGGNGPIIRASRQADVVGTHDDVIKWKHFPRHWPSPVTGEFPAQRPVTRSFGVFFDLRLNKRSSKHSWGWWFETPSRLLWRRINGHPCTLGLISSSHQNPFEDHVPTGTQSWNEFDGLYSLTHRGRVTHMRQ